MFCRNCGAQIPDGTNFCPYCGSNQTAAGPEPLVRHQQGEKPSTYLVLSIIVTILCCLPFGIIGIIYASKVDSCWNAGNFDEARENSRKAKTWALVGLVLGFVTYLIYILLIFLGVLDFWGYDDYLYMSCLS
ncbi:MAG: CD225/dispanin family protein [Bacteroidetes bacterium]|uniref:CD225/dispanin family protein n=1 Tax=Candidatus Cryptobacteroides gallistercoris TaxID=2840765 RepID=A0A940IGX6_9BACT|nr:CD225/dispanin family protein [Candidatus Cryptobacteroides gallistercoris]